MPSRDRPEGWENKDLVSPQLGTEALAVCQHLRSRGSVRGAALRPGTFDTGGPAAVRGWMPEDMSRDLFRTAWRVWQKTRLTGKLGLCVHFCAPPEEDPPMRLEEEFGGAPV